MPNYQSRAKIECTSASKRAVFPENSNLERHSWRNWFLLVSVSLITTMGLVTAIPPLLSERSASLWPWGKTDLALLVGLSIAVLIFVSYLTYQQRQVVRMRRQLRLLEEEVNERAERHIARLYALLNVSRIMGVETDPQGVFDCITKMCVEIFNCDQASLMLFDKKSRELVVRSANGHSDMSKVLGVRQKIGEGIAGWAAEHREVLLLGPRCGLDYPDLKFEAKSISAAMVVPIILRDELVGVLNISARWRKVEYGEEDLRALQVFAENVGVCIRHTEQADWMRQTIRNLQTTLTKN